MKKLLPLGLIICVVGLFYSFQNADTNTISENTQAVSKLKWYSWEEAVELNKTHPKKLMVDVYTSWCGWCKVMDKKTFTDPKVIALIQKNFYPVKLDAEQKEDIHFQGNVFKYTGQGRRGANELAVALLNGRMSFPSIVYLNEKFEKITVSPGYKKPDAMITELKFIGDDHYLTQKFAEFAAQQ